MYTQGIATFVGNLFAIPRTPESVTYVLDDCAKHLVSRWGLRIGGDAREYLMCKGYPRHVHVHPRWMRKTFMKVLGHYLDNDAGTATCVRNYFCAI